MVRLRGLDRYDCGLAEKRYAVYAAFSSQAVFNASEESSRDRIKGLRERCEEHDKESARIADSLTSFTQYVYKLNGVSIPRSSRQQSKAGTYVPRSQLQPGDLVFFYSPIHHVAIYMGNGKILHTYGKGGVTISNLNSGNWNRNYTTARRVLPK
ncbi:NlpC/P60 family protein [Paenibacillus hemerocallicola]|uniref:NlpC/P60 family protein n=1 Tax=Paenibacillus hemerocallicola TaxID=1172614 RepID=A0A5C4TAD1_9BACL|nr:NlpC/P60 family protein [Paenibacillus hemerocallicola]